MNLFSDRFQLSQAVTIVDDAPKWFRSIFVEQVVRGHLTIVPRSNSLYKVDREHPVGTEWLFERMCQLAQRHPGSLYLAPYSAFPQLKQMLENCEWFFFYDAVEIVAEILLRNDNIGRAINSYSYAKYAYDANAMFVNSGIGWHLDNAGLPQRKLTEERAVAEAQLQAIELHSPAKVHLAKAALMLKQRPCDSANSIKESVSAIESFGRKAYPHASTLGDVLKELRTKSAAPPLLLAAIEKVYAFACAEPGVRHGNADGERVGRADAEFTYVMAMSSITYLESLGLQ